MSVGGFLANLFDGLKTYDPAKVVVLVNQWPLVGFAPDTYLEAHYFDNKFRTIQGSEGESTRTLSLDRSGAVRLALLQPSASNALLGSLASADRLGGGTGIFDFSIKDPDGNLLIHAPRAWVEAPAPYRGAAQAGTREWVIVAQQMELADLQPAGLAGLSAMLGQFAQNLYDGAVGALGSAAGFDGIPGG